MALYLARQPDGGFAIFDDLSVNFVATGLRMGEAAALFSRTGPYSSDRAWREMMAAVNNMPIGMEIRDDTRTDARFDDLLNAVTMIRGRAFMKMQLCAMGMPLYEPASEPSDAVLELRDCYLSDGAEQA